MERRMDVARRYRAVALVEELRWVLRAELDYLREGRNAERFSAQFADDPFVGASAICWDRTTRRVLTMEHVDGIRIDDVGALEAAGIDRSALARRFARMLLASVLLHGFFHGDPHPGNYLVRPDGSIAVVDFGMTGHVTDEMRGQLVSLLLGVVRGDVYAVSESLADLGIQPPADERTAFRRDVAHLLVAYYGLELGDLQVATLLGDFAAVARSHAIAFPPELALLTKAAAMGESVTRQLDPSFNSAEEATEFAREALAERYSPAAIAGRVADTASEAATLVTQLPGQLRRVRRQVEHSDFEVRLRRDEIEMALDRISAIVNRLGAAIIGAAIAIAVALVLQIYRPPGWQVFAAITVFGGPLRVAALWLWSAIATSRRR
jgi:ubiquinone biosynthesis protein